MTDEDIDALRAFIETRLEDVNFCLPGTVASYDGRYAVIQLDMPKQITDGRVLAAPQLHNVPVRFLRGDINGALAQVTVPLKKGDGGLMIFAQRSIDDWVAGNKGAPLDPRMFDLNDGYFLPGVNAGNNVAATDTTNLCVTYGSGGMKIAPNGTTTFLGPVIFEDTVLMQETSTFDAPVNMSPDAPISANGGITGKDGFTFETHIHDVVGVQSGGDTKPSTPPVA